MKLFQVCESLRWRLESWLLPIDSFAEELLRANLLRGLTSVSVCLIGTSRQDSPGALFLTLGGPRDASMFAD